MAVLLVLLCTVSLIVAFSTNGMLGPGRWNVLKLTKCPDDDKYPIKFDISRRKVNRTHDGFNLHGNLDMKMDSSYGVFIDACKYVDGGCKQYQIFADDCVCCMAKKYAGNNMKNILTLAGLDPPDCPVPAGALNFTDYVFNYEELPVNGVYGTYDATAYILSPKDDKGVAQQLGCLVITLHFEKNNDDE